MAKRFDPKAKARKQKIVAGVLGVLFLGVMAYQAPTILGLFSGGSSEVASEPAPPAPPAPAAPVGATPVPAAAPAAAGGGAAQLVDSDPAPAPTQGQLVTFDRFETKDPFAQQAEPPTPNAAPPAPAAPEGGAPNRRLAEVEPQPPAPTAPASSAGTAKISVNGVATDATVGGTFPKGDPIFKLLSMTRSSAKVGIADGTYATGAQAITLRKGGKPVTLMNTADGTTYVLRLLSVG
jgi:hypothetical protein